MSTDSDSFAESPADPAWLVPETQATTARGQRTKERIIDSAEKLFRQQPYTDISVADITSASKVSVGSFYRYFESKEEVFLLLVSRVFWRLYYSTQGAWRPDEYFSVNLERTTTAYLKAYYDNRRLLRSAVEATTTSARVRQMWWSLRRDLYELMLDNLRQDQAASPLPAFDPLITIRSLAGMVEEYAYRAFSLEEFGAASREAIAPAARVLAGIWFRTVFGSIEPHTDRQ